MSLIFFFFHFFFTQIRIQKFMFGSYLCDFFPENILDLVIGPSPPFSMQDLIQVGVIVEECS